MKATSAVAVTPTLYVIRHGETDWNRAGRLQGRHDVPINHTGEGQAARNAGVLRELLADAAAPDFVSSPLLRARQTMEIVRGGLGLPEAGYATDARLQEIAFGDWEGRTWKELKASTRASYDERYADPWAFVPPGGGESYAMVTDRVAAWLAGVRRDAVVVSHGGISRCLRGIVLSLALSEIPHLAVPQDRIMIVRGATVDWV